MMRLLMFFPLVVLAAPKPYDSEKPEFVVLSKGDQGDRISLDIPAPNITQAYYQGDAGRRPLLVNFNADATEVVLEIPEDLRSKEGPIILETTDQSVAYPDGRIIFSALDARVEGPGQAKLETHPGNHRIGFWGNLADTVVWDFSPTTCGMYYLELTYSLAGKSSEIEVMLADRSLKATIASTGSWYRYTTAKMGKIYLEQDKPTTLRVKGIQKSGGAVMNLKAVTLRPAPEGENPIARPGENGEVILSASEATVYGIKLRYEIQPEKLCIGYWTIPSDYATWDFELPAAVKYKVTLFQGCGEGQGGSAVNLHLDDEIKPFKVLETGHFQNFQPVELGTFELAKGAHRLELRPTGKVKVAVMDVQKLVLTPVP